MKKKFLFDAPLEGAGAAPRSSMHDDAIAIIGLAVNLPGATDERSLLSLLREGSDQLREFPATRVADVAKFVRYYCESLGMSARFFRGAWLDRIDEFDRTQFRMSPAEAKLCDPHQRLFLQAAWQAINDAGYGGDALKGSRTAVIACGDTKKGISYLNLVTEQAFDVLPLALTGNNASYAPARLSYLLDLHGPASVVDTGCCSSLVGVHQACQGLLSQEYDCAIVGSSELNFLPLDTGLRVGIESADGTNRTFSADASGTGLGEGAVCVVLKRYQDALRDRDPVHAVIRGSAVNHSGRAIGLTAPTPSAQADVIDAAWRRAGVYPDELGYVEAHGTATALGDPIELQGLTAAFRRHSDRVQRCAIGSVKSQIGHLMNSAGLAGLVKTVLAVKHGEIFPSAHFSAPNAAIDFIDSPFYVSDRHGRWPAGRRRLAGVSSYSMTGTNCHMVVEAADAAREEEMAEAAVCMVPVSAQTPELLRRHALVLAQRLRAHPHVQLADFAFTLAAGREHHACRLAVLARSCSEAADLLDRGLSVDDGQGSSPASQVVEDARSYLTGAAPRHGARGRRLHLPAPPMDSRRHWIDTDSPALFDRYAAGADANARHDDSGDAQTPVFQPSGDLEQDRFSLAALVRHTFARKLGLPDVDPQAALTALGGDSMTVIQIVATLNKQIDVVLNDVYAHPTVAGLTEALLRKHHDEVNKPELFAKRVAEMDALLDNRMLLAPQLSEYERRSAEVLGALLPAPADSEPDCVLLTGATGFMGAHFLHHLLHRSQARIVLLVRAGTPPAALERVQTVYRQQHGEPISEPERQRIEVLCGDAAAPRFALAESDWSRLLESVSDIIHLAARVRHSGDYAAFEKDNVVAVEQVLACARGGRRKRVHFASSTAVAHGHYAEPPLVRLYTEFDRRPAPRYNNPYSKSKVAAEQLLERARDDGIPVNIYRFGNVLFHSRTGRFQHNVVENGIYSLIRAFAVLGCHPDSPRRELDFGFVEQTTAAFFAIFGATRLENGNYHVFNPHCLSVNEVCDGLASIGYPMERLPLNEFVRRVDTAECKERHGQIVDRLLFHLGYLTLDLGPVSTLWEIENKFTNAVLAHRGFEWSPASAGHVEAMVRGCPDPAFFPALPARQ
jgi:thioester reductase-like protein